jgi:hypothetical protein
MTLMMVLDLTRGRMRGRGSRTDGPVAKSGPYPLAVLSTKCEAMQSGPPVTNKIHFILVGMHIRTSGPTITNRIQFVLIGKHNRTSGPPVTNTHAS